MADGGVQLSITFQNIDQLQKLFTEAPTIALTEFGKALDNVSQRVLTEAIANAPQGKTGALKASITRSGNAQSGYNISVGASYGIYVDLGTKPHTIVPKNGSFLAFQSGGGWVFTKRVNHPGTRATHFFTDAITSGQNIAESEMTSAIERIISQITV